MKLEIRAGKINGRDAYIIYVDGVATTGYGFSLAKAQELLEKAQRKLGVTPAKAAYVERPERVVATAPVPRPTRASAAPAPRSTPVATHVPSGPPRASRGFPGEVMLAKKWESQDPTGWMMSEKLDGVRAYWDGARLYTRNGNSINAPKWFTASFPDTPLDGELWAGRGNFQDVVSYVRKDVPRDSEWKKVAYIVFDGPGLSGGCEQRFAALKQLVDKSCRGDKSCPLMFLEQTRCTSEAHLKQTLAKIEALKGEGVMLRAPGSRWEAKRSSNLLKVKNFFDEEARITGYEPGKGKHKGVLGAYNAVLLSDGTAFKVGTGMTDAQRARPLPIGTIITISYQEKTRDGSPRFPSFVGVRHDLKKR